MLEIDFIKKEVRIDLENSIFGSPSFKKIIESFSPDLLRFDIENTDQSIVSVLFINFRFQKLTLRCPILIS